MVARDDNQVEVSINPAGLMDFWSVLSLERACFGRDAWPFIDILLALLLPDTVRLKAEHEGRLIAFALGDRHRREGVGWIATIAVHPDYRRSGIGRNLLRVCERELGTERFRLTLRKSNKAAMELYLNAGYREVGRWAKYYHDGEDGIVMEKLL